MCKPVLGVSCPVFKSEVYCEHVFKGGCMCAMRVRRYCAMCSRVRERGM